MKVCIIYGNMWGSYESFLSYDISVFTQIGLKNVNDFFDEYEIVDEELFLSSVDKYGIKYIITHMSYDAWGNPNACKFCGEKSYNGNGLSRNFGCHSKYWFEGKRWFLHDLCKKKLI